MSQQDTSAVRLTFLGIYRLVPRLFAPSAWTKADEDAVQRHFERLQAAAKKGSVILAGRTLEDHKKTFGIVVFEAENPDDAQVFMVSDPAVVAGVMIFELHPYRVAVLRINNVA
jgi:uncharacterized protein YciI